MKITQRMCSLLLIALFLGLVSLTALAQRPGGGRFSRPSGGAAATPPSGDQVGERTGRAGMARTGGRSGDAKKPTGAHMSEAQQQNIQKLSSDLQAIKQGSQVTPEMKQALKNDLMAMAEGATKPDPAAVDKLASDLSDAMSDGKITNAEKAKLSNDLYAVMNSANIPASEVNAAIADAKVILTASGISKNDVQTIANDLKAIANEAKK